MLTWGAIGGQKISLTTVASFVDTLPLARTTESQLHRELASGVSFPVGFKNGTDGGYVHERVLVNSRLIS